MSLASGIQRITFTQTLAKAILRLIGWRTQVIQPQTSRYVIIGAPHTSNWDFVLMLLFIAAERIPIRWLGKDTLFRGLPGKVMHSLGGIPVNRRERTNLVDKIAEMFDQHDSLVIGISPEGTRGKTKHWKTGFYYIALKAQVPIVMGYLDYTRHVVGLGPSFIPTGDIQEDFKIIEKFYSDIQGKFPHEQGKIEIAPR